jgi:hypothetical protein
MALDKVKGLEKLKATIRNNTTHRDYKRVTELAKRYKAYVTGEGADELIQQFIRREDDEAFAQRVAITRHVTPYMASRIMAPMFKAGRTMATIDYHWTDNKKVSEKKDKLTNALGRYYGEASLEQYLVDRMVELDSTDANAFIVTELPGEYNPNDATQKAEPYPFEVSSEEAIDFWYKNNLLQYLTVRTEKEGLKRFTIYVKEYALVAQQISEEAYKVLKPEEQANVFFKDLEKNSADEIYILSEARHGFKRVPAVRVGSRKDLTTRGRTRVPMMHSAECFFEKSIQSISEFDLSVILHAFPQKIQFDDVCPGDMANNIICIDGKTPDLKTCPKCKGSGFNEHRSAQDTLRVKRPREPKDIFSLENMIAYKTPPGDILTFLKVLNLEDYPELAVRAVYISETFTTDTVAKTATETNVDMESVYDALTRFMNKFSAVYKHITNVVASYLSVDSGFTVIHKFPKDLKMKTVAALMADLKTANDSGAPSYIKKAITRDIARKLYLDNPDELLKIEVKQRFFPFDGKSEAEVNTIVNATLTPRKNLILYANFDSIFDQLEEENTTAAVSFWKMEISAQRKLVEKKVEEIMLEIDAEQASMRSLEFGNVLDPEGGEKIDTPVDVEAEAKAKLKGSVGGVEGILSIQTQVSEGITPYSAALSILELIYGINQQDGRQILGDENEIKKNIESKKTQKNNHAETEV